MTGALLFILCYLLDNCDGEIARLKNLSSRFGDFFDTFADWLVHTVLFIALGYSAYILKENSIWLWLGGIAAAGATINYLLVLAFEKGKGDGSAENKPCSPPGWKENFIYVFRELMRWDFCFILFILALFDATWVLLPFAAVGAQAYWLVLFIEGARNY